MNKIFSFFKSKPKTNAFQVGSKPVEVKKSVSLPVAKPSVKKQQFSFTKKPAAIFKSPSAATLQKKTLVPATATVTIKTEKSKLIFKKTPPVATKKPVFKKKDEEIYEYYLTHWAVAPKPPEYKHVCAYCRYHPKTNTQTFIRFDGSEFHKSSGRLKRTAVSYEEAEKYRRTFISE